MSQAHERDGKVTERESAAAVQILTSIRSDRVIRAIDVIPLGHSATLVLDDLGGKSLDRYLAHARFSLADTLRLAIHVAAALRDVHAAGVIHRDVTPEQHRL